MHNGLPKYPSVTAGGPFAFLVELVVESLLRQQSLDELNIGMAQIVCPSCVQGTGELTVQENLRTAVWLLNQMQAWAAIHG
jgi:hypothetical protein